jgi:hypothetical protein
MRRFVTTIAAGLVLVAVSPAVGQAYTPDIAEFDGTNAMAFPPDGSLDLSDGGTIEFWVLPEWTQDPGYDPAIVSNIGTLGASYMVVMLGSRKGVGVAVGDRFESLDFDFTDGKLHHVSISDFGEGSLVVIIDNVPIGTLPLAFRSLPSSGFFIGSADGVQNQFKGALAGLRIWELPVEPDDLALYAMQSLVDRDGAPHPDITTLVGISDFNKRSFALLEPDPIPSNVSDETGLGNAPPPPDQAATASPPAPAATAPAAPATPPAP